MKYSYTWLKEFVPRLPAPEKLASLIARHAFEVESVVKSGRDTILDVAVLANRLPDAAGHIGFSREIAAITKLAGKFPDTKPPKSVGKKFLDAAIKPRDLAPRYLGALVSVKIQPSPAWLRERLTTLDIHTINNVVDITNYVMLECGHPLHAFDHSKIRGKKMTVRLAREGEKLETLDGSHLVLPGGVIVIQDAERIIDLAGIMGGANSAVDSKTKTIFLQAANFDPARIHRAARKLGKRTDAAIRYAAGLDPNAAEVALALAIELLKELAAGEVLGVLDIYPDRVVPARILFHPARASAVLGTAIPEKEMRAIFERLGFDVETAPRVALRNQKRATLGATGWTVVVPTARRDIAIEEDLIEEVGRIYGYDSIPETRPQSDLVSAAAPLEVRNRDRTLAAFYAAGFTEARTYSFIGDRETALLDDGARKTLIELENPQSRSATALRPLVLPSLALAAAEALKFTPSLRYCELARVFRHSKTARDTSGLEENRLAFIVAEKTKEAGRGFVFYELKGALDSIFESLGLPEVWYDDVPSTPALITQDVGRFLHPYQAALIKIGNRTVGIMGVVHPDMRNVLDIPVEAAAGELYFDAFEKELESEKEYRAVSKYPAVLRDIAVLVPKDIRMTEVEDRIQNAGGELLADVDLFDAFEGDEIGADKKNLAFHLIFQSEERTLTVAEVEALMKKITSALEADEGWEVR